MRRLTLVIVFALWSAVLAYGAVGSAAWFTDKEVLPVSAAAASLNIQVENLTDGGVADSENGTVAVSHDMTGMLPGVLTEAQHFDVNITNIGEIPTRIKLTATKTGGSNNIYNNLIVWALQPNDCSAPEDGGASLYGGPINDLSLLWPTILDPGMDDCIHFEFKLAETATDSGGTAMFNLVFTAGQLDDPAFW